GDVVVVAVAGAVQPPVLAVGIDPVDAAGRRHYAAEGGDDREQAVLAPEFRQVRAGQRADQPGVVAAADEQRFAVRGEHDGVWAVFTAALHRAELLDFVQVAAGLGGADAVQAVGPALLALAAAVDHHVQAIEGPQQALGAADLRGQLLDPGLGDVAADRG